MVSVFWPEEEFRFVLLINAIKENLGKLFRVCQNGIIRVSVSIASRILIFLRLDCYEFEPAFLNINLIMSLRSKLIIFIDKRSHSR